MGDNIGTSRGDCQLEKEVVIRIRKGGSPEEVNLLQATDGKQEVQKRLGLAGRAMQQILRTKEHIPILNEGRNRHGWREFLARQEFKQSIGSSPLRPGGGDQHAGVQYNTHRLANYPAGCVSARMPQMQIQSQGSKTQVCSPIGSKGAADAVEAGG